MSGLAASLPQLAALALAVLARDGEAGSGTWSTEAHLRGIRFRITARGPALAAGVPEAIAPPELVRRTVQWRGAYRLEVCAPLNVLELEWNSGEPLRIFAFSRGSWEAALAELAPSPGGADFGSVTPLLESALRRTTR